MVGESVDTVPMSEQHASWLQEYVNDKYHPEPKNVISLHHLMVHNALRRNNG
jgi:hypothetical protein